MAFWITCPNCGGRPCTEFSYGGEAIDPPPERVADPLQEFERVTMSSNLAGIQRERWFHDAACRRWLTVERDTTTNQIHDVD